MTKQMVGVSIRDLRERRGLTQAELAEKCGFSVKTIGLAERGRAVTQFTAQCIAGALNVQLDEISDVVPPDPETFAQVVEWLYRTIHGWMETEGRDYFGFPVPPEFFFRVAGDWKGWNHVFGAEPGTQDFEVNAQYDKYEDGAFCLVGLIFMAAMERARPRIETGEIKMSTIQEILSGIPMPADVEPTNNTDKAS